MIDSVTAARAKLAGAGSVPDQIAASNDLSGALSRLLVVVENYPNLKSDATFARLMDELAGTENRLSVERKRYNDSVQVYNVAVRQFPGNLMAGLLGFREQPFFEVPAAARQVPPGEVPVVLGADEGPGVPSRVGGPARAFSLTLLGIRV